MSFAKYLALMVLGAAVLVGCGAKPQFEGGADETSPEETVKTTLEQMVQTGQAGSNIGEMMQALEKMKETDAAKAEALLEDANQLMSSPSSAAIKTKAKEMLDKLSGGSAGSGDSTDSSAEPASSS